MNLRNREECTQLQKHKPAPINRILKFLIPILKISNSQGNKPLKGLTKSLFAFRELENLHIRLYSVYTQDMC